MSRPLPTPVRRRRALFAACVAAAAMTALTGVAGPVSASASDDAEVVLRTGLAGSSPDGPVLFGSTPGTRPWDVDSGRVRLDARGDLEVRVRGLVIPTAPFNGTNPVPLLSVSLVCNGAVVATTGTVPFSTTGDARVRTRVALPQPCLAPAVLIRPNTSTTAYIAASG